MKRIIVATLVVLGLLLIPMPVSAASGVSIVEKTGDGTWVGTTWQVSVFPNEVKSTTLTLYNSSSGALDVEVSIIPDSLDGGNLVFQLSKADFTMPGRAYTNVTLIVRASGSATPGMYTTELGVKSEVLPGGGGGAVDRTPPRISDVVLCDGATETTADICWKTNEKSTSQVKYWTSPPMFSELDKAYVIRHRVQLSGLTPGTTYYYKTMSRDRAGNLAVSDEYSFTTLGKVPEAIFVTSNLSITPGEVNIGGTVTIGVIVSNTGTAFGSYMVTLRLNGMVEATKEVTLKAGISREVNFTMVRDKAATYSVGINGLTGSFTVKEKEKEEPLLEVPPVTPMPEEKPFDWLLVGGIIVGIIAAAMLVFLLLRKQRD